MYRLLDVRAGIIQNGYIVLIEQYQNVFDDNVYWLVSTDNDDELTWLEYQVPKKIKQLHQVLVLRGSAMVPKEDKCVLQGPSLSTEHCFIQMTYSRYPIGDEIPEIFYSPGCTMASIESWVDEAMALPWNHKCLRILGMIESWKTRAKETKKRIMDRTYTIEEELMRKTWHPHRFRDWCLDAVEKEWLTEHTIGVDLG